MQWGWRAYYPGDETRDSSDFVPFDLPDGVVCVVEFLTPPYRHFVSGGDWYVWDGERWSHTGTGPWGEWQKEPTEGVAVRSCGRLAEDDYEMIMERAAGDRQWPS